MCEIQASDAETHFCQTLDEVERGETIIITRHGRAIARLVPEAECRHAEIDEAIRSIKEIQTRTGKATIEEILSTSHEGHKY